MPLPLTVSCFCKIQIGFTFVVPAQLGSAIQRAVKRVCVCMYVIGGVVEPGKESGEASSVLHAGHNAAAGPAAREPRAPRGTDTHRRRTPTGQLGRR